MADNQQVPSSAKLAGHRVFLTGRFAGMPKRAVRQVVAEHGGSVLRELDSTVTLVVVGEDSPPMTELDEIVGHIDPTVRETAQRGDLEVITESALWQRLGMVDGEQSVHRLYTPAMLAELLGVSISVIRRWNRLGLIQAAHEVHRLAYFDFQEVATAKRLAEMLASGLSPESIAKKLGQLERWLPEVSRPLAQLSVIVEGKQLLLRQGDGLIDSQGQLRIDFDRDSTDDEELLSADEAAIELETHTQPCAADRSVESATPHELISWAENLEDRGDLNEAAEMYRGALALGGPKSEVCFALAELLYRRGDLPGARERYFMTIELDEEFVEARSNLGCVLAELGEAELAVAAFEGALHYHGQYPDAHFHLARVLDELGRREEAIRHWQAFLDLASESPWAEEARRQLGMDVPL